MSTERKPLGVILLTIFVSMVGFGIVIPVLPIYARSAPFKLHPDQLGYLTGIFSLAQLIAAPFFGKLSDRFGRKPILLISILGTTAGYLVTGAANAAWMLFAGRIIDGISGGNIAIAQTCIADVTPPKERSKAMGLIGAAFGLGFILGPAIGGLLSAWWGPAAPFYFAAALSLVNAGLVVVRLPETLSPEARLHPAEKASLGEVFAGGRAQFISVLLVSSLVFTTGFAFIHLLFALFCRDHFQWGVAESSYAFAYVGFVAVLVQGGLIRRLLKYPIEKELTVAGCFILALSLWLLPGAGSVAAFLGIAALLALGNGLATPTFTGMASRHVHGRAQGRALGLMAGAGSLGRFLGPWLASKPLPPNFADLTPSPENLPILNQGYTTGFHTAAALALAAGIITLFLRVPRENPEDAETAAAPVPAA